MRTFTYKIKMEEMKICPKEGLKLRKVGKQYMIVEACEGNVNMSHVYSLNQTAAQMWERIPKETVPRMIWLNASANSMKQTRTLLHRT